MQTMKLNNRAVVLLISLVVLLTVVVGVTVAFIIDGTNGIENTFTPSRVDCEVERKSSDGATSTYALKNTGDTEAYIRAAVLVNWKNGTNIYAQAPEFDVEPGEGWVLGKDGYYYYTKSVAPGAEIGSILTVSVDEMAEPVGFTLTVEIVASAIQATVDAVNDWSDGVATAGTDGGDLTVAPGT